MINKHMICWIPLIDLDNMMLWSSPYVLVSSLESSVDISNHVRPGTIDPRYELANVGSPESQGAHGHGSIEFLGVDSTIWIAIDLMSCHPGMMHGCWLQYSLSQDLSCWMDGCL